MVLKRRCWVVLGGCSWDICPDCPLVLSQAVICRGYVGCNWEISWSLKAEGSLSHEFCSSIVQLHQLSLAFRSGDRFSRDISYFRHLSEVFPI